MKKLVIALGGNSLGNTPIEQQELNKRNINKDVISVALKL